VAQAAGNGIANHLRTDEVVYDFVGHCRVSDRYWFQSGRRLFLAHRFLAGLRLLVDRGVAGAVVDECLAGKFARRPKTAPI
jgi:hypothetical protein